jgi:hypothetical protein
VSSSASALAGASGHDQAMTAAPRDTSDGEVLEITDPEREL